MVVEPFGNSYNLTNKAFLLQPTRMKAAILLKKNEPLSIEDIQLPSTLSHGQVRVKILVSGLCGAQLQEIAGLKGNERFMPHLLGHEGCGIVEEVGPGVTKVKPGNKVVLHWRKGSGIESDFPIYIRDGKPMGGNKITTLSEYSIVSENRMTKIDNMIDHEFAALLGCGLSTGFAVVNKEANVKFGESVMVVGSGGVGLNCIRAAALSQASVLGLDMHDEKRDLVMKNGGTFFNSFKLDELIESKRKFDCIIDTTGILDLVSKVLPLLSEQGRLILVAQPKPGSQLTVTNPAAFFSTAGQTIKTTQAGGFDPDVDIPRYTRLFLNKQIDIDTIVTHRFPLSKVNDAVTTLRFGTCGRIMVYP